VAQLNSGIILLLTNLMFQTKSNYKKFNMNIKSIILASVALTSFANATITLNTAFGVALDSSGIAVPDGTLWALVVDGGDSSFPGGFGLNDSLTAAGAAGSFAPGQQFALGRSFGSDKVFAIGGFNGLISQSIAGSTFDALSVDPVVDTALVAGRNAAFYFFPGVNFTTSGATYTIGSQVGGLNGAGDAGSGTEAGLVIPSDSATAGYGVGTAAIGGVIPSARFTAVNLVPEPSSALLSALGVLGLLRRRRN
jgi:PEP-CTERM motif